MEPRSADPTKSSVDMATRLTPAKRKSEALTLLDSPQISALFEKARLAVDVPVEPAAARRPSQLPSVIGIGLLCAISWWCFAGLRSGVLRSTLPGGSHAASPAIGDTCLYRGDFFPSAGTQTLRQLNAIKGNADGGTASGLVARGTAFVVLCNWFTSACDSYFAPLALNLALCWLCAWILSRATTVLFHDRAKAAVAATCFSLSIVATFSVGDFGPRLF